MSDKKNIKLTTVAYRFVCLYLRDLESDHACNREREERRKEGGRKEEGEREGEVGRTVGK